MKKHNDVLLNFNELEDKHIRIEDIAHNLSYIARFVGSSEFIYTVGEHCVIGAKVLHQWIQDSEIALGFLLHDASEAYISDIPSPVKACLLDYQLLESKLQGKIEHELIPFSLTDELREIIKIIDKIMLKAERDTLFEESTRWEIDSVRLSEEPLKIYESAKILIEKNLKLKVENSYEYYFQSVRADFLNLYSLFSLPKSTDNLNRLLTKFNLVY